MKLTPAYIASQVLTCGCEYDGTYTVCTLTTRLAPPTGYRRTYRTLRRGVTREAWSLALGC
jgi:hypothetical protein